MQFWSTYSAMSLILLKEEYSRIMQISLQFMRKKSTINVICVLLVLVLLFIFISLSVELEVL